MTHHQQDEPSRPLELNFKHRAFVEAYCVTWRPQEAAIAAGYSRKSAHVTAYRLLENVRIRAAIEAKLRAAQLSADHVLARLSEIANANFGDFLVKTVDGQITNAIDVEEVKRKGHLVKRYKAAGNKTGAELELHDALRALELIGKALRLFGSNAHGTTDGKPLEAHKDIIVVHAHEIGKTNGNTDHESDSANGMRVRAA